MLYSVIMEGYTSLCDDCPQAMDLFNMGDGYNSVVEGLSRVKSPVLVGVCAQLYCAPVYLCRCSMAAL